MEFYFTITVPTIAGCKVQWYGNSPAASNLCSKVFPLAVSAVGPAKPESNSFPASAAPVVPDVTVWNAESSFVHTTV